MCVTLYHPLNVTSTSGCDKLTHFTHCPRLWGCNYTVIGCHLICKNSISINKHKGREIEIWIHCLEQFRRRRVSYSLESAEECRVVLWMTPSQPADITYVSFITIFFGAWLLSIYSIWQRRHHFPVHSKSTTTDTKKNGQLCCPCK